MILLRNPTQKRVPLLPTLPTLASFPGGSLDLFRGGVLQSGGRLETTTILGVP